MSYLPRAITSSSDLAVLLNNTRPMTAEDAAEGPLEWGGLWIHGNTYDIDMSESSDTRCVLEGVAAAVDVDSKSGTWSPVVEDQETFFDGEGVVTLDYKEVWLAHGRHSETETFTTLGEAEAYYQKQLQWMRDYEQQVQAEMAEES